MKLYKVTDPEFRPYGKVIDPAGFEDLIAALAETNCPKDAIEYLPSVASLEETAGGKEMFRKIYGECPIQIGYTNGTNTKLNGLEYHRASEINFGATDSVLLIGKEQDIEDDYSYDTSKVEAFLLPKGCVVEVYATTLHFAPCNAPGQDWYQVGVVLPAGTNTDLKTEHKDAGEDIHLTANNKWLLLHPDMAPGSPIATLKGKNLDTLEDLEI